MIIPIALCIDVEPDPRLVSRTHAEPWDGYVRTCEYVQRLRTQVEDQTGSAARFCWSFRADPQIADAYGSATYGFDRYPRQLAVLLGAGDAIGAHVHPFRWTAQVGWLSDFGDPGWIAHCVQTGVTAVRRAVGVPCRIFRFGDRWHSTDAMNVVRECGVRIDLTLEPGVLGGRPLVMPGEPVSGGFVGFEHVPREPYTPSRNDFRVPASPGPFCALPLTSAAPAGGLLRRVRRWLEPKRRQARHVFPLSLWRPWTPPGLFTSLITRAIAAQRRPYLAFAVRTDLGARKDVFDAVDAGLRELLAHPLAPHFRFCTPEELLRLVGWRQPQRERRPRLLDGRREVARRAHEEQHRDREHEVHAGG